MKVKKDPKRKELLRDFFLNASLIAMIHELVAEQQRLELAIAEDSTGYHRLIEWAYGERPPAPAA